jgi:hypothetical protein
MSGIQDPLMAAAPDLLAALKLCEQLIDSRDEFR